MIGYEKGNQKVIKKIDKIFCKYIYLNLLKIKKIFVSRTDMRMELGLQI
jgi:hypothetical protein